MPTLSLKESTPTNQPIWLLVAILGGLLLLSLVVQLSLALLSYDRILPVAQHVDYLESLQHTLLEIENQLAEQFTDDDSLPSANLQSLHQTLLELSKHTNYLAANTPGDIRLAQQTLANPTSHPRDALLATLKILRTTFQNEASAHKSLTHTIYETAKFEVDLGVFVLVALPVSAVVLLIMMRRRIFIPLQQMGYLMELLAKRQYQRITPKQVDPMFQPLMDNYNHMVERLSELETEHLQYQRDLEQQVEKAARTLIEQQRNLANTERLAALGEFMARLAHELRNPLAGVKIACANMKTSMQKDNLSDDYQNRMALLTNEIDRIIQLLNSLLEQASHDPEQLQDVSIATTLQDLLTLAHYQTPEHISLNCHTDSDIVCRLPDSQFRQALLNLIINAQQAMGSTPGKIVLNADQDGDTLIVSVYDEGPGFPSEIVKNGIRPFSTCRKGGTGLGLSMVQRFVRSLDGKLILSNREPHGACVTMKLHCVLNHHA